MSRYQQILFKFHRDVNGILISVESVTMRIRIFRGAFLEKQFVIFFILERKSGTTPFNVF